MDAERTNRIVDHDVDLNVDHDVDLDVDHDVDLDVDHDVDLDGMSGWLKCTSVRATNMLRLG